ncbi:MAG: alpha/beta hydrolase [Alphaproteobacteria bacterium]|nr:alpha/beta hydrolase [Alphaproteobacteria bacterium]
MSTARHLSGVARTAARVAARRARHGPRHPHWSWQYETLLAYMRDQFRQAGSVDDARRQLDLASQLRPQRRPTPIEVVDVDGLAAEWAVPEQPTDRVILYLHGGGYSFGSVASHRALVRRLARVTRARVLSLEYRLAPEHPCPAAIDDALTAWRWLRDRGIAADRIHLAGDSAGGGLSLATLLALRDADQPLPAGAVLLSPWTDLTVSGDSTLLYADDDYLGTQERLYDFAAHYAGKLSRSDTRVSPLFADLHGLPPLLVLAGGVEVILDDSVRLADRARNAGVTVDLHVEPGEVHVYPVFAELTPTAKPALERIASFVGR